MDYESLNVDIFTAASICNIELLEYMLSVDKSKINSSNKDRWTPLMYATYGGDLRSSRILIECGAQVNCTEKLNETPLMKASRSNSIEVVKLLIKTGLKKPVIFFGESKRKCSNKFNLAYISAGASLNIQNVNGHTALYFAAIHNNMKAVELLLAARADPNIRDATGMSPLMHCSEIGNQDIFCMLIAAGARTDFVSSAGMDAASIAQKNGHYEIMMLLNKDKPSPLSPEFYTSSEASSPYKSSPSCRSDFSPMVLCSGQTPYNLDSFLKEIGLECFSALFKEQKIDFPIFLSLTDNDLKQCGIKLGPRRKLTAAISQCHRRIPIKDSMVRSYVSKLERENAEMRSEISQLSQQSDIYHLKSEEIKNGSEKTQRRCRDAQERLIRIIKVAMSCKDMSIACELNTICNYLEEIYQLVDFNSLNSRLNALFTVANE